MENWQSDLLTEQMRATCEQAAFKNIVAAAQLLGFDYCAYGLQIPTSFTNPKIVLLNNYPLEWQKRYVKECYSKIDPTIHHARRSRAPILWTERLFAGSASGMWEEAQAAGLRVGWAQSNVNAVGVPGMLTLARSSGQLSEVELASQETKMRWLVEVSHFSLSKILVSQAIGNDMPKLTAREIEILKWTADGKTSSDISHILNISENTVNFHIKNAIAKLNAPNKTAAVVRACMLGLLS